MAICCSCVHLKSVEQCAPVLFSKSALSLHALCGNGSNHHKFGKELLNSKELHTVCGDGGGSRELGVGWFVDKGTKRGEGKLSWG